MKLDRHKSKDNYMHLFFIFSLLCMSCVEASEKNPTKDDSDASISQNSKSRNSCAIIVTRQLLPDDRKRSSSVISIPKKEQAKSPFSRSVPERFTKSDSDDSVSSTSVRMPWPDNSYRGSSRSHGSRPPTPCELDPSLATSFGQRFE